jgi:hypothetical protein
MQILRHHAAELFGFRKTRLSSGQRYHFIAGWLPWVADGINLLFNIAALCWSLAMVVPFWNIDPPLIIFSALPLALFCFKIAKVVYLYRGARIVVSAKQTISAALAGLALSHTIARAVWQGLFTTGKPFLRTPKKEQAAALTRAVGVTREECLLFIALWAAAWGVSTGSDMGTLDLLLWVIVLLVQSIPYFASLLVSVISAFPGLRAEFVCGGKCPGKEPAASGRQNSSDNTDSIN